MMLTTDEMMKIMQEEVNGKESTIHGSEASDFRKDLSKDIAKAKRNGWVIEIPGEWEVGEVVKEKGYVWPWQKYNPNRDESGRFASGGGGGGGGTESGRTERAKRTHKTSTAEKQQLGEAEQKRMAKVIGGENDDDNKPFDVTVGKHGIEVKTVMDNNNDKITVHPDSRRRKETAAKKQGLKTHTVAIDVRGGKRAYYHKEGVGAFRLSSMEQVSLQQLKEKFR